MRFNNWSPLELWGVTVTKITKGTDISSNNQRRPRYLTRHRSQRPTSAINVHNLRQSPRCSRALKSYSEGVRRRINNGIKDRVLLYLQIQSRQTIRATWASSECAFAGLPDIFGQRIVRGDEIDPDLDVVQSQSRVERFLWEGHIHRRTKGMLLLRWEFQP